MQAQKKTVYMVLSSISTLVLIIATYFMIKAIARTDHEDILAYRHTFYSFIMLILLIKVRVQMGFRIPRGHLFHVHLASAIILFVSLGILAFIAQPLWLVYLMWALYTCALTTGTVLFYRGTMQAFVE